MDERKHQKSWIKFFLERGLFPSTSRDKCRFKILIEPKFRIKGTIVSLI